MGNAGDQFGSVAVMSSLAWIGLGVGVVALGALVLVLSRRRDESASPGEPATEAVLVHLVGSGLDPDALAPFEDRLDETVRSTATGEFDGNEVAVDGTGATLYLYGPSAERLYAAISRVLEAEPLSRGARVEIRAGPPGSPSRTVRVAGK